jgi:hypothetical protein
MKHHSTAKVRFSNTSPGHSRTCSNPPHNEGMSNTVGLCLHLPAAQNRNPPAATSSTRATRMETRLRTRGGIRICHWHRPNVVTRRLSMLDQKETYYFVPGTTSDTASWRFIARSHGPIFTGVPWVC